MICNFIGSILRGAQGDTWVDGLGGCFQDFLILSTPQKNGEDSILMFA